MTAPRRDVQAEDVVELYKSGLSLREVGARVGLSHTTVKHRLLAAGVRLRAASSPGPAMRQLTDQLEVSVRAAEQQLRRTDVQAAPERLRVVPSPREVRPERAAVAFTADRGWHVVEAPPGWFLDLLAELD